MFRSGGFSISRLLLHSTKSPSAPNQSLLSAKLAPIRRDASQLYPTTSHKWDSAMIEAETTVGHSSDFSNLHKLVSGEFIHITKYLQKLIGSNHPMLETAKRCTYISEGKMGSAQARGLTVMLTAMALENLPASYYANSRAQLAHKKNRDLMRDQVSLAEMTEITYSAYMMHRGVMDLKKVAQDDEQLNNVHNDGAQLDSESKGIHYGNKVSILCGDFLLAYVMRGLGDLFSSKAVDLVASAITDFMEAEFLLLEDWKSKDYLLSNRSRDISRWERRSNSTIGSLQGNTCQAAAVLANVNTKLQMDAKEFGKNLGLAWQAHTELQPFLKPIYEPIQLAEMPQFPAFDLNCLPVLLYLQHLYKSNKNYRLVINEVMSIETTKIRGSELLNQHIHQDDIDYEKLHRLVVDHGQAIDHTYSLIEGYSQMAMSHLKAFPQSRSRDVLENICLSLYDRDT